MQRLDNKTQTETQDFEYDDVELLEDKYSDFEDEYGDQGGFRPIIRTKPRNF